jgi:hypothetical protein
MNVTELAKHRFQHIIWADGRHQLLMMKDTEIVRSSEVSALPFVTIEYKDTTFVARSLADREDLGPELGLSPESTDLLIGNIEQLPEVFTIGELPTVIWETVPRNEVREEIAAVMTLDAVLRKLSTYSRAGDPLDPFKRATLVLQRIAEERETSPILLPAKMPGPSEVGEDADLDVGSLADA